MFPLYPELVLEVAMRQCTKVSNGTKGEFLYCGYDEGGLQEQVFDALCSGQGDD